MAADIDSLGRCPRHPFVQLRLPSARTGEWRALLDSCPLCAADDDDDDDDANANANAMGINKQEGVIEVARRGGSWLVLPRRRRRRSRSSGADGGTVSVSVKLRPRHGGDVAASSSSSSARCGAAAAGSEGGAVAGDDPPAAARRSRSLPAKPKLSSSTTTTMSVSPNGGIGSGGKDGGHHPPRTVVVTGGVFGDEVSVLSFMGRSLRTSVDFEGKSLNSHRHYHDPADYNADAAEDELAPKDPRPDIAAAHQHPLPLPAMVNANASACEIDAKGRCIHHPHVRLRKKRIFGRGWKVIMSACPDCCVEELRRIRAVEENKLRASSARESKSRLSRSTSTEETVGVASDVARCYSRAAPSQDGSHRSATSGRSIANSRSISRGTSQSTSRSTSRSRGGDDRGHGGFGVSSGSRISGGASRPPTSAGRPLPGHVRGSWNGDACKGLAATPSPSGASAGRSISLGDAPRPSSEGASAAAALSSSLSSDAPSWMNLGSDHVAGRTRRGCSRGNRRSRR